MAAHCCDKGLGISRCPSAVIETPAPCDGNRLGALNGSCASDGTLLCLPFVRPAASSRCLVYSFGIAKQWHFEDWAASAAGLGCEVHAFDPTTRFKRSHAMHAAAYKPTPSLPSPAAPTVAPTSSASGGGGGGGGSLAFHFLGLAARPGGSVKGTAAGFANLGYGSLGGDVLALDDLQAKLGHKGRTLNLLKIDCEGCEWEAFVDVARRSPATLGHACTLIFELHFARSLQMGTPSQLALMAEFWERYVVQLGFRLWFVHPNPGAQPRPLHKHGQPTGDVWGGNADIHPALMELGHPMGVCCYEVGLYRPSCAAGES